MNEQRIEWIDIAKGLGMILVIMGHSYVPEYFNEYLLSFHMPLFFLISGYLFYSKKNQKICEFIQNKARTLLIPYFVFSFASYIEWAIVEKCVIGKFEDISYIKPFVGIFYSNNVNDFMIFNGVLWFITCLFVVEVMYFILNKYINTNKGKIKTLVLFALLGYLDSLYMPIRLPWGVDLALTGIAFYGLGNLLKGCIDRMFGIKLMNKLILIIAGLIISIVFSHLNDVVYMYENQYGNFFAFYFSALSGILTVVLISMTIKKSKILSYIGKNTVIILALHGKIILYLGSLIKILLNGQIYGSWFWSIILTVVSLIGSVPFIYIINRYLPFVLGKKISDLKLRKRLVKN